MFQSLCSIYPKGGYVAAMHRMVSRVHCELDDDLDDLPELMQWYIMHCIDRMIHFERLALGLNYFVFYRVVNEKYILYEFNTLLLEEACDIGFNRLVCTPSLFDEDYPESMEECMDWFKTGVVKSDMCNECIHSLISVNCTLFPESGGCQFYHEWQSREANPLYFYQGYDTTLGIWEQNVQKALGMRMSAGEAMKRRAEIRALYLEMVTVDEVQYGHCLQICVPESMLLRFVYPCVTYGKPISIHTCGGRYMGYDLFPFRPNPIPFKKALLSPAARFFQSRIIAHPNLFLSGRAVVNVLHGHHAFDEDAFRKKLCSLMAPLLANPVKFSLSKFK